MNDKYKVLLVDDDRLIRHVARVYFKRIGYTLDTAENGLAAIDKYRENHYDLILMDVRMPIMDGLEATKKIRELEKMNNNSKKVRIIAITASSEREECFKSGMNDYYQKPILMDHIHQILSEMA